MPLHLRALGSLIPAISITFIGCLLFWQATDGLRAFTAESARRLKVAEQRISVSSVELMDFSGQKIALPARQKVTLVEFIYTTCPTICQAAGSDYFQLMQRLHKTPFADQVRMLSVSFDLENDDHQNLATYAENHGADGRFWTVAKPDKQALADLLREFGITVIPDRFGGFKHNAAIHIVDRKGRLVAIVDTSDIEQAVKITKAHL